MEILVADDRESSWSDPGNCLLAHAMPAHISKNVYLLFALLLYGAGVLVVPEHPILSLPLLIAAGYVFYKKATNDSTSRRERMDKGVIVALFAAVAAVCCYQLYQDAKLDRAFADYLTTQECRHARDPIVDCRAEECTKGEKLRPRGEVTQKMYFCHLNGERMTYRLFKKRQAGEL